ncbi:MAG: hypothetical protein WCJ60_03460 [bacterium]
MLLSAKTFFDDHTNHNIQLLERATTNIPKEFIRLYKKNVVSITPKKTGALRRSIITQALGNTASISWRSPYAAAQNKGYHDVTNKRVVNIDGRFVTLMPGRYYYRNYTTPGTGPRFAFIAFQQTQSDMPAVMRELGLTK